MIVSLRAAVTELANAIRLRAAKRRADGAELAKLAEATESLVGAAALLLTCERGEATIDALAQGQRKAARN